MNRYLLYLDMRNSRLLWLTHPNQSLSVKLSVPVSSAFRQAADLVQSAQDAVVVEHDDAGIGRHHDCRNAADPCQVGGLELLDQLAFPGAEVEPVDARGQGV